MALSFTGRHSKGWLRHLFGYLILVCPQSPHLFLEDQTDCIFEKGAIIGARESFIR